jgi:hypothetical protein
MASTDDSSAAAALTRKLNLAILLQEELEADGLPLPAELTNDHLAAMTEAQIRAHYTNISPTVPAAAAPQQQQPPAGATDAPSHEQLRARFPHQQDSTASKAWFPALATSRRHVLAPPAPTAVVLAFHPSGTAEDVFTSEGTGSRCVPGGLVCGMYSPRWKAPGLCAGWHEGLL